MIRLDQSRRRLGAAMVLGALAGPLAACDAADPGDALWPTAAFQPADPWQAAVGAPEPAWWDDRIAVSAGAVDDRPATLLRNLATDRSVTVHYLDGNGARQSIVLPAGGSVGVAAPPAQVIAID